MRFLSALTFTASVASAAQWYGIAPDNNIAGQVNLFFMSPTGQQTKGAATIITSDNEYPKSGTLTCHWYSETCYFLTGTGNNYIQDYLYAVNRTSGALIFKHVVPAGIYLDNLILDWTKDELYAVTFDPARRDAFLVQWSGVDGGFAPILDIRAQVGDGFVFGGGVSYCPTNGHLYIALDNNAAGGTLEDAILIYDLSVPQEPIFLRAFPLLFPVPSATLVFCNATGVQALIGDGIFSDSEAREKILLGDLQADGNEGLFVPIARGNLPTFSQRGETALFLNGMLSQFGGDFLAPVFPPFQRGPGPVPNFEGGFLVTHTFGRGQTSTLTPLNYYLAGASGVPNL